MDFERKDQRNNGAAQNEAVTRCQRVETLFRCFLFEIFPNERLNPAMRGLF